MDGWIFNLIVTILVIVLSAFFVIIEFSLLSARRNRLEETAETSRASRAGLRSLNELTIMLAGAQLGITAATFILGAVTKPWVHHLLVVPLEAVGLPLGIADVVSFIVALFIVTFLHLVIGEMAPKSWAITHPETALHYIAIPARGFIWLFRPLLVWINNMANAMVRRTGETPVDRAGAAGYDVDTLRTLVEHSRETGTLDESSASQITGVIELETSTVGEFARLHGSEIVPLPSDATVAELQSLCISKDIMRALIYTKNSRMPQIVHVRDTLMAEPDAPALQFSRPALTVAGSTTVQHTLDHMRARNEQMIIVGKSNNKPGAQAVWILTWNNIMNQLWPQITEELDKVPTLPPEERAAFRRPQVPGEES